MPAKSRAQQRAAAIAEHHPEKLYARNRDMLKMSKKQLHDFAKTPRVNLPRKKRGPSVKGGGLMSIMRRYGAREPKR